MADFPGEIANAGGNLEGDLVEDDPIAGVEAHHHDDAHVVQDLNQPLIDENAAAAADPIVGDEAHHDEDVHVALDENQMLVNENAVVDHHHGVHGGLDLNVPFVDEDAGEVMAAPNDGFPQPQPPPPPQQQHPPPPPPPQQQPPPPQIQPPPPPQPLPMPPVRQAAPTAPVFAPYPSFIPLYRPPPQPLQPPRRPNFSHNLSLVPPFGRPPPLLGFFYNPVLAYPPRGPQQPLPLLLPNPVHLHPQQQPLPLPPQQQLGPRPPMPPPVEHELAGMGPIPLNLQGPEHHLYRLCRKRLTMTDLTCNLRITGPNREFLRYRANQAGYNFPLVVNVVVLNGPAALPITLYRYHSDNDRDRFLLSWIQLVRSPGGFNLAQEQFVDMWFEIAHPTMNIYIRGDPPPPPPV